MTSIRKSAHRMAKKIARQRVYRFAVYDNRTQEIVAVGEPIRFKAGRRKVDELWRHLRPILLMPGDELNPE